MKNDRRREESYPGNYADKPRQEKSEESLNNKKNSAETRTVRLRMTGSAIVYAPPERMVFDTEDAEFLERGGRCGEVYAPPEIMGGSGPVYAPPEFFGIDDSGDASDEW
jgi:hypothetical protein